VFIAACRKLAVVGSAAIDTFNSCETFSFEGDDTSDADDDEGIGVLGAGETSLGAEVGTAERPHLRNLP
jgi:hypothetical protein